MIEKGYNVKKLELAQDEIGAWYYRLNDMPYTGVAYALFPNGKLSYEYNLVKGYQEGIQQEWYQNGLLKIEFGMKNNINHGIVRSWFENGVLKYEAEYDMGVRLWSKKYNEQGELIKEYP